MRMRAWICAILALLSVSLFASRRASGQDLRAGVEQLAAQVAKAAPEGKQLRIAVADFPDLQGITSDFGRFVSSRLTTRLANNPRFFVIERQRLGQVLAELRFSMSDLVDPAKAKQLGRMVGVEAIVVGTVSDLGNQVELDARIIEIETNRMLLGATTTISKDQVVAQMMQAGRQGPGGPSGPPGPPNGVEPPAPPGDGKAVSLEGFIFQPRGCRRQAENVFCGVAFVNTGSEDRSLTLSNAYDPLSRLIDDRGNQYRASIQIGDKRAKPGYELQETFVPQLPTNVVFFAESVDPRATRMTVVIGIRQFKRLPAVREIPVTK